MVGAGAEGSRRRSNRIRQSRLLRYLYTPHTLILPRKQHRVIRRAALQLFESYRVQMLRVVLANARVVLADNEFEGSLLLGFVRWHWLLRVLYFDRIR